MKTKYLLLLDVELFINKDVIIEVEDILWDSLLLSEEETEDLEILVDNESVEDYFNNRVSNCIIKLVKCEEMDFSEIKENDLITDSALGDNFRRMR